MRRLLLSLLCAAAARSVSSLPAQSVRPDTGSRPASVGGRLLGVFDEMTGNPVVGATVIDALSGDHTITSTTGTVSLWFVRTKGSIVQVRMLGYEPWSSVIDPADTTPITVIFKRVTELAAVVTKAPMNIAKDPGLRDGFEQRCQNAHVTCVREDVIDAHPSGTIGDLILRADGVLCGSGPHCGIFMHSLVPTGGKGRGSRLCTPTYYIDGYPWDLKAMGGPPIGNPYAPPTADFNQSNVKSVEVYAPDVPRPLRFSGNPLCGVVALWTK